MPTANVFLTFLTTKTSSDQFGVELFAKIFLYFDILTGSRTSNLGSSILFSLLKSIYVLNFTSAGLILIVLSYVLLYLLHASAKLSNYTFFDTEVVIYKFCSLQVLINLSAMTNFPSLHVEYIFISSSNHDFFDLM